MKFRKRPEIVEATQWFKNGDHPLDYNLIHLGFENGELREFSPEERREKKMEGDIVRYFLHPNVDDHEVCKLCGRTMKEHGWIESETVGRLVHPGDWVIKLGEEYYSYNPIAFVSTYEPVEDV